ncbi:hypothetical protein [Chitinophaga filiformis]|uniref:Uncharacterized protein n=1 Tax=Chitinophaga filiformis TaxID=104663 RepID=A0A1G7N6T4_CHIFI|nr:hypothetical protein [Chitinophaga filiformis]SDF69030.1 hypothetical protein SAMN04488121_102666 [Chitinophaga filiformis]
MPRFNITIETLEIREYKAYNPLEEKKTYSGELKLLASVSVNTEQKNIAVVMKAEVYVKGAGNSRMTPAGYIETVTIYSAVNEWKKVRVGKKQSEIDVDKDLEDFLIDVSYNSTRGLLSERGKNDLIGKVILPVIDPADIKREKGTKGEKR